MTSTPPTEIYTLSLHDALPILVDAADSPVSCSAARLSITTCPPALTAMTPLSIVATIFSMYSLRSEEHTSELQSQSNLVCRLLLEKKNTFLLLFQTCAPRLART